MALVEHAKKLGGSLITETTVAPDNGKACISAFSWDLTTSKPGSAISSVTLYKNGVQIATASASGASTTDVMGKCTAIVNKVIDVVKGDIITAGYNHNHPHYYGNGMKCFMVS